MAYVTMKLTEYNDHCFAFDSVSKNPDVPFGKVIECHTKYVFINEGKNETRMISSVHCHFIGKPPMIAWKIRNAMYSGVTSYCVAKAETICSCIM